jgi:hypothetical protein
MQTVVDLTFLTPNHWLVRPRSPAPPSRNVRVAIMNWLKKLLSEKARTTIALRLFCLARIPMMFFVRPSVVEISLEHIVVRIAAGPANLNGRLTCDYLFKIVLQSSRTAGVFPDR